MISFEETAGLKKDAPLGGRPFGILGRFLRQKKKPCVVVMRGLINYYKIECGLNGVQELLASYFYGFPVAVRPG